VPATLGEDRGAWLETLAGCSRWPWTTGETHKATWLRTRTLQYLNHSPFTASGGGVRGSTPKKLSLGTQRGRKVRTTCEVTPALGALAAPQARRGKAVVVVV
jgi:hypothetical protein